MFRSKAFLALVAVLIVGVVLLGTGVGVVSALALRSGAPQAIVQRVVDNLGAANSPTSHSVALLQQQATPTATPDTTSGAATTTQASSNSAAPAIVIQPGVDSESQILEAVYQKVNPSVVTVYNLTSASSSGFGFGQRGNGNGNGNGSGQDIPQGEGSGWVWSADGYIVTNDHVVAGADKLQVTFSDGTQVDATLVGTDPNGDIAVIKVDPKLSPKLVPVEVGDSSQVKVGEMAIAIGNPFGFSGTMTRGIVSAVGRSIPSQTQFSIPEAIQTDAAINPGNSGGPLLNAEGKVIGVNDQIQSASGSNSGVGFAIPINIVKRIVPALIQNGKYAHSYLGMTGGTYSRAWADALGLPADAKGAYVMDLVSGGPADKAGLRAGTQDTNIVLGADQTGTVYLQKGGDLITAVDGTPITKMDDLLIYLEEHTSPGQVVKFTVLRAGGQQATVPVTLGTRPEQRASSGG